ncbi:hypothetical protein [Nodularia spumigena]|mgnify:CR=1 FL=1|uniref:Uncharacterized protein n=2 Tax=Nodularia spumigena TaxID=70799 RepID=A0A166K5V8_NODSP|nr:hypothetical protein [Nodularia spumigena]KZL50618.1 hypothetical protein A2T98_06540 [Nodularia spumigena CENA596]MDB9320866.1 hypothetical protein [Nodularia spumigena CS-591/07A]MDB9331480.1 hypothetical protein [Nodularia spumigena CS-591/04]MDB9337149.1 hypothetical protein [Nodularia spumigena CS-590/01]MDB9362783.1 hypothetical protein [Nodularia spumigena CS-588/02]
MNEPTGANFDDADKLRDLSEKIIKYINTHRENLSPDERRELQQMSENIRKYGLTLATKAGVELLKSHQSQLDELLQEVNSINELLNQVSEKKRLISTVSKIVDTLANVVKLIPL